MTDFQKYRLKVFVRTQMAGRTPWYLTGLLAAGLIGLMLSCTNLELDPLGDRFRDNMSGGLSQPADITPAGVNFTFAVMGDTHIGNPSGGVMNSAVGDSKAFGDAFVLVTGDLTDNGDGGQFREFRTVMAQHNMIWRAAIGNHDIFFGGWDNYKGEIGRSIYSINAGQVHIAFLDSANGVLGTDQLDWLESDLSRNSKPLTVVLSHFPPWNGSFSGVFKMTSDEEAAVLKDILNRHHVNLMFSAHYHGFDSIVLGGVQYIVSGGANDILDPGNKKHYIRVSVVGNTMTTQLINIQ